MPALDDIEFCVIALRNLATAGALNDNALRLLRNSLAREVRRQYRIARYSAPKRLTVFCSRCGSMDDVEFSDTEYVCSSCNQKTPNVPLKVMGYVYTLGKDNKPADIKILKGRIWLDVVRQYTEIARKSGFIVWMREDGYDGHYESLQGQKIYLSKERPKA